MYIIAKMPLLVNRCPKKQHAKKNILKNFRISLYKAPNRGYNKRHEAPKRDKRGGQDNTMRKKLQELRIARGYTQVSFSKAVGISRSHYSQIETGEKTPSLKLSLKIKAKLNYTDDDIFFDERCPVSRR